MTVVVLSQEAEFYAALDAAEAASSADELPGLASPLGAAARGLTMEAWDAVRSALERVWTHGAGVLDDALAVASEAVESILRRAGDTAREVRAGLTAQLQVYISEHVDRSLSRVRGAIQVEGASLRVTGVSVTQSIQLGGSLKASITEVLALTAQGQILITAEYGPEVPR